MRLTTLQDTDPVLMTLGERTTRLPAEPVNPRAAFDDFERGDHTAAAVREVVISDSVAIDKIVDAARPLNAKIISFDEVDDVPAPSRDTLLKVARKHYVKFGSKATKHLIQTVGKSVKLDEVPNDRVVQLIGAIEHELSFRVK